MPKLLISDNKGKILIHPQLEATGMKVGAPFALDEAELVKLPPGSQLFKLPDRSPVGYNSKSKAFVKLNDAFALAAFAPAGYTATYSASYQERDKTRPLPLFSYAACAFHKGSVHVAAIRVDKDRRHDLRFIEINKVKDKIKKFRKTFPSNRLVRHLEDCALKYGCPNAQNFFLSRYEAPLPASPSCNASCAGCISYQCGKAICASQPRIKFAPNADDISQIALFHIANAHDPIVSFGQGCEGEPLLAAKVVEKSIKLIRNSTAKGIINMNTNGSNPAAVARLLDAGLDSIRISLNSSQPIYYSRYYRPVKYSFEDVMRSIEIAGRKGAFLSLNYLTMPGFTDSADEFRSFRKIIGTYHVDMVQWRNLNIDPILYFKVLKRKSGNGNFIGIREVINSLKKEFPRLLMGYFNPRTTRHFVPRVRG